MKKISSKEIFINGKTPKGRKLRKKKALEIIKRVSEEQDKILKLKEITPEQLNKRIVL